MRKEFFAMGILLAGAMAGILLYSCKDAQKNAAKDEPVTVRIAYRWTQDVDPSYRDPVTGEPNISPSQMEARLYAERQVLEKLKAKIVWVGGYDWDTIREVLLRSALSGDPFADLVQIFDAAHGVILAQNVLQPLDQFESLFQDEDSKWMLMGKMFGHNYFLNDELHYGGEHNLFYNIGLLNKVPALKENGKTVLPVDLWLDGKWTWSVFEDYLQKVHDYTTSMRT